MQLDKMIKKLIMAMRHKGRIVKLSKQEFYSYKFQKVMSKYEFHEMTRLEVDKREEMRSKKALLQSVKYMTQEEFKEAIGGDKFDFCMNLSDEISYLKEKIKMIKLEKIDFINKVELVKFLAESFKNGDPNEE